MFQYAICGLSVDSEIALPGVQQIYERSSEPDAVVRRGSVPAALEGASTVGPNWQILDSRFLLHIPGIARYLIADGREIVMEMETPGSEGHALPFLLSTGVGALLHQRGDLVLHAATVSFDGRAVALCGRTGIGKSTLAAALCQAGGEFVGDDMAAVRFDPNRRPFVSPDGRQHRLWADSIEQLSLADRQGPPVREKLGKFHVGPAGTTVSPHLPLTAVAVLSLASASVPPGIVPLKPVDAVSYLRTNVYRPALATRMGRDGQLFGQIAALLAHARVFHLHRGTGFDGLNDAVRTVLTCLQEAA